MTAPVLVCHWDGEAFVPRVPRLADKHFVVGEDYPLVVQEERSRASHNRYFAALHEGWLNLPEDIAAEYPTEEHLRKKALIRAGYADERSIVCASKAEAQRVAAFIKPMDDYAIVVAREATIKVFTAKSQSTRAMGKRQFQESQEKVLDIVSQMIGTDVNDLKSSRAA